MVLTQFLEMKNKLEIPECIFKLEDMLAKYGLTAFLLEASPFYLYALCLCNGHWNRKPVTCLLLSVVCNNTS